MKKKITIRVMVLLLLCLFTMGIKAQALAASEEEVITRGVFIDSVDISGMTKEQAKDAVDKYTQDLKNKKITITVDDVSEDTTLEGLGFHYIDNTYFDDALLIGKSGNLIKRYKELKDTEEGSLVYNLNFTFDADKVKAFIEGKLSVHNVEAQNAAVKRENRAFVYTDHTVGRKVNVQATLETINDAVFKDWDKQDITLQAVVEDDIPKYTREDVEKVKDLLGTFSTTYTTSSADRAGNLANGARLINNTVLYPGDVFSAYDKLTPFTIANGYFTAGAYANGKVVDSIGGGSCQVTTTLYNAILLSELEIVERYPHSMTVGYVKLSMDSAIAGTWKDLKFKNDKDSPILIEVYTKDRTITFNIWGNETRDTNNRKVKYESVVLRETKPGADVVTKDATKPETYQVTTQSAHIGYVAELYKIVYENGTEVSRTRVNKSIYNASPRYVTVGTMVEEKEEEETTTETSTKAGETEQGQTEETKPGKKPTVKPTVKPDEKPVEQPVEQPEAQPTAKPAENPDYSNTDDNTSDIQEDTEITLPDDGV